MLMQWVWLVLRSHPSSDESGGGPLDKLPAMIDLTLAFKDVMSNTARSDARQAQIKAFGKFAVCHACNGDVSLSASPGDCPFGERWILKGIGKGQYHLER